MSGALAPQVVAENKGNLKKNPHAFLYTSTLLTLRQNVDSDIRHTCVWILALSLANCVTFHSLLSQYVTGTAAVHQVYPFLPYSRAAAGKQLHSQQLHFQAFIKSRKDHVNEFWPRECG